MGRKKDLAGQIFGKLKVVAPTKERITNGSVLWDCECYILSAYAR